MLAKHVKQNICEKNFPLNHDGVYKLRDILSFGNLWRDIHLSQHTQHKTDYLKNCEKTVAATVDFCQTKKSRPEAESKNDGKVVILWQKINAHPFNMSSKSMSCSLFWQNETNDFHSYKS